MKKREILLNPGPVNTSPRVQQALLRGDMCHREAEFSALMASIRSKLLEAFDVEKNYKCVLITGSGTAALEMGVSSCLSPGRTLLVIDNGVYGDRIAQMADAYGLNKKVLSYEWGTPPNLEEIERALKEHPEIEVLAVVHHETTTGLLNPLQSITGLAKKYGVRVLADCISSLGGDPLDFDKIPLDFCIGTANKCIQGFPGVSFVLVRSPELERLESIPPRSLYFNLYKNYNAQEKGDALFTPAIQAHYAFDEALSEFLEETPAGRIERYRAAAELLRDGFKKLGLRFLIPENFHSNTLTSLELPEGMKYSRLHDRLKEKGFVIYAGQGNFNDRIFRVANMGDVRIEEFQAFLSALEDCLSEDGHGK